MSSKLIPGDGEEEPVRSFAWRKLGQSSQPSGGTFVSADVDADDKTALIARVAHLEKESDLRERRAHDSGFQAGETTATQRATQQMEQIMSRVAQSIQEMFAMRHMMRRQMEEDLVRLAIVVARRILHRELTVDPEALLGIVKAAVEKIEMSELNRIRMSTADAPVLGELLSRVSLPERVEMMPDPGLERGSVILETTRGILDSSIDTQLEEIERGFVDLVRRPA